VILVVDMNYKKNSLGFYEFVLPIASISEKLESVEIKHYLDVRSEDLNKFQKIILSGTALKDNATLDQPEKFQWIENTEKPILGICAGLQTIGVLFGLSLIRCVEIGMTNIVTTKENPLFSSTFKAYSLHNYTVAITKEFESLAESTTCLQALKHKKKPLYGVLFHPEVRNPEILNHFIEM
jgi:GMP synthase (glutamine-hydrolysing)